MEENKNQNKIDPEVTSNPRKGIVETYAGDMAGVIEDNQGGTIRKIIEEEEAKEVEQENQSPETKQNKLFLFFGIFLIVFGVGIIAFILLNRQNIITAPVIPPFTSMIYNDQTESIEISKLTKDEVVKTIWNKVKTANIKNGEENGVYLTNNGQLLGLREFITLLKSSFIPGDTIFINDNFQFGIFNHENKHLFVLMEVRSFQDIFDPMRAWESKMFYDLHGLFGWEITSETNYLLVKSFEDGVVENKNARILYDNDGNIALMYVFADDNHMVIADNADVVREVIVRLAGSRIVK